MIDVRSTFDVVHNAQIALGYIACSRPNFLGPHQEVEVALKTMVTYQWDGPLALAPQMKISGDDGSNQDRIYFSSEQVVAQVTTCFVPGRVLPQDR